MEPPTSCASPLGVAGLVGEGHSGSRSQAPGAVFSPEPALFPALWKLHFSTPARPSSLSPVTSQTDDFNFPRTCQLNGADDAREGAHDPDAEEGLPSVWGDPGSHPRPARPGVGALRPRPFPHPALLPGRGTKLVSIQSSPVTNVMLVNKPPAGHQGTTQAHTHCGGQARAHPEPGRGIRFPQERECECVLGGLREGSQVHCPFLSPTKGAAAERHGAQMGCYRPISCARPPRRVWVLDGRRPRPPQCPPPVSPSPAEARSPIN